MPRTPSPLILIVLDGWGLRPAREHNAIALAQTPTYQELLQQYPHASLVTSGDAVGLPSGQMGNSEVGHMNLGAGRIIYQDLTRIDKSVQDGNFFENPALITSMDRCLNDSQALHLIGLVSDGGGHSHLRHLEALVRMAARRGVQRVFIHALTDGRDTAPTGGADSIAKLERTLASASVGRIASVIGRYYAMDRDQRWERTRRAYNAMTVGDDRTAVSATAFVREAYGNGVTDEFIEPGTVVDATGQPIGLLADGDSVVFFNFRSDRARQLTRALAFDGSMFDGFERKRWPRVHVATLTEYDETFGLPVAFKPEAFSSSLADVLADYRINNLKLAETEKYAHVTYFFNCGKERPLPGEDRILVPSPKVPTYDLQPEMSARDITARLVDDVENQRHRVIICNFANADMVGHTGKIDAAVTAVSTLDQCLTRIVRAVEASGGTVMITADHGNAEQMWDAERQAPHTAHTSNSVPVLLINTELRGAGRALRDGSLRDVAPTMLGILGIPQPVEMTGRDLRTWDT